MSTKLMPPRLRDWVKGKYQVGLFLRLPNGNVLEMTVTDASEEIGKRVHDLLLELPDIHKRNKAK